MTGDSAKRGNRLLTKKPENWEFITDKTIERLRKAAPVNRIIWDTGSGSHKNKKVYAVRGFGVRITEAGSITFVLNYHNGGKERRYTIGRHAEEYTPITAREKAKSLLADIAEGHDPLEERQMSKEEPTFEALAKDWLEYAKTVKHKRASSLYDDRLMLGLDDDGAPIVDEDPAMRKRRVLPVFGERRLSKITQREIALFHSSLKETPYRANRVLVLIKTIFNYSMTAPTLKGWIEANPAQGIPPFREEKHEDCLDKAAGEITRFLRALDTYGKENPSAANCLRLLLLTGSRESEVLKAKWSDFDLAHGVWTKLSHNTKQKTTEHVQLGEDAVDLLRSMKPKNAIGPLFPGRDGKGTRESLKRPWLQICKAIGRVKEETVQGKRIGKDGEYEKLKRYRPTLRIHDLRHTFASVLVSSGESLYATGRLLGHVQASTTQRYAHFAPEAARATANKFAQVIEFKKRRA